MLDDLDVDLVPRYAKAAPQSTGTKSATESRWAWRIAGRAATCRSRYKISISNEVAT
jgi:hypothetical protein